MLGRPWPGSDHRVAPIASRMFATPPAPSWQVRPQSPNARLGDDYTVPQTPGPATRRSMRSRATALLPHNNPVPRMQWFMSLAVDADCRRRLRAWSTETDGLMSGRSSVRVRSPAPRVAITTLTLVIEQENPVAPVMVERGGACGAVGPFSGGRGRGPCQADRD